VQLSIIGKGGKVRQVLLPEIVSRALLSLRGDAGANDPVFASRKGGPLTQQGVDAMVKRAAKAAGINAKVSPHWLRHTHGSHAIARAASLPEVQATLGHFNDIRLSAWLVAQVGDANSSFGRRPNILSSAHSRSTIAAVMSSLSPLKDGRSSTMRRAS
jgi:integrase/recombinase XerD